MMKLITTSWDDGHIADLRLAELLEKYKLPGTFYVPSSNHEREVMCEKDVVSLSHNFEIGGHTMNHVFINSTSQKLFSSEISGCYHWLTELLGYPPVSFCFPRGVYNNEAVKHTLNTGFKVIRTTELLNPWVKENSFLLPTTLQVYEHNSLTYIIHLSKRLKLESLFLYLKTHSTSDLIKLLEFYLHYIEKHGGCFHLWGHSWEIDKYNLWTKLEDIFKILSNRPDMNYIYNKDFITHNSN